MYFLLTAFMFYALWCIWIIWMLCKAVDRWKDYAWKLERRVEQLEASEDALVDVLLTNRTIPADPADWWKCHDDLKLL